MVNSISVKKRNGKIEQLNIEKINKCAIRACDGLKDVSASEVVLDAQVSLHEGITTKAIDEALILSARSKIEKEPNYSYVAARIHLNCLYKEVFSESVDEHGFDLQYRKNFITNIKKLVKAGLLDKKLLNFDLKKLSQALVPERDMLFKYIGIKNISDRYLLKLDGKIMETPQAWYMRVSLGICLNEDNPEDKAIELYNTYSQFLASPATPTLFNSGTTHSQLSSCYLSEIGDSIDGIFDTLWQEARKSKYAGGLGFHFTKVRGKDADIKGTHGKSSGVVPWLKIYNDTLIAVDQGGKRSGSGCAYIEPWHIDFPEFLDLRKNTGDERRRTHDMNTACWMNDLLMERIKEDSLWTLFCPNEVRDLPDLYGKEFKKKYEHYEKLANEGKIKNFRIMKAKDLWKDHLRALFSDSHPWITFKDPSNIRYSNIHEGILHGSNLCCVTGDQRVPTQKGLLTVKELYEEGTPNQVVGRDKIYNATRMEKTIENAPILKITTKQGYEHKVTYDHPLWVVNRGWVRADQLKIGDKVETQAISGIWGNGSFEDEALLAGFICGDGCLRSDRKSAIIALWERDFNYISILELASKKVIEKYKKEVVYSIQATKTPKFRKIKNVHVPMVQIDSSNLSRIFSYLGWKSADKLTVPEFVWKGSQQTVINFLRGLFYSDGYFSKRSGKNIAHNVCLTSISHSLLQQVQILLANFGIKCSLYKVREAQTQKMPKGHYYFCKAQYRLEISSREGCEKADRFLELSKQRQIKNIDFSYQIKKGQKFHTTISEITKCPNENTYCLKVDSEDHAWVCNGLITKNTEILLHTKHSEYKNGVKTNIGETAVCNLSSINLPRHVEGGKINYTKLANTVKLLVRALDNIIEINFYPTEEAQNSNFKHRPIGLGQMGFSDLCHKLGIIQDSNEGIELAGEVMEFISYHAILTSSNLAKEKGKYSTYKGSKWDQGKLPIDTWHDFMKYRGKEDNHKEKLDWSVVRKSVEQHGMRNSNVMAIAPTASISYQQDCNQSIEPDFSVLFVYENKSGNFCLINEYFVEEMKNLGLWTSDMINKVKAVDGDISLIPEIPKILKERFCTAFNRDMFKLIDANVARQIYIDQSISFNMYNGNNSLKYLNDIYLYAWEAGLKTTYYLRNKPASKIEKATTVTSNEPKACSIEAMKRGESCESCQ